MELGVGIGYLSFLAWMPVPELAPEPGRGSRMAARRRKWATVGRWQEAAARLCSEGVRGGGSPCAGVWGGLEGCGVMPAWRRGAWHGSVWPLRYCPAYPQATAATRRCVRD